jgi:hypothetical protein
MLSECANCLIFKRKGGLKLDAPAVVTEVRMSTRAALRNPVYERNLQCPSKG